MFDVICEIVNSMWKCRWKQWEEDLVSHDLINLRVANTTKSCTLTASSVPCDCSLPDGLSLTIKRAFSTRDALC